MVNKKITDHMSGSNDITLLKVNHAEYYSLRDRQLQEIGACSDARHEAFSWTRLRLDANPYISRTSLSLPRVPSADH